MGRTGRLVFANMAVFAVVGVAMPYWPVWLESRGASAAAIGLLLGLGPWVRTVVNPIMGRRADVRGNAAGVVVGCALVMLVAYVLQLTLGYGLAAIFAFALIGAIGFAPIIPLLDGLTLRHVGGAYGRVRLWGSAAFILGSWSVGRLLERHHPDVVLYALIVAAAATVVGGLSLLGTRATPPAGAQRSYGLMRRPAFVRFIVAASCLQAAHAVLYGFGTLHWQRAGVGEGTIGAIWAIAVFAEILLFYAGATVNRRFDAPTLFKLAALAGLLRWTVLANSTNVMVLVVVAVLHAATFAATHLGAMAFIREQVDDEATSRATTLYSGLASGLSMGLAMPIAGFAFEHVGGHAFYGMVVLSAVGGAVAFTLPRRPRTPR